MQWRKQGFPGLRKTANEAAGENRLYLAVKGL